MGSGNSAAPNGVNGRNGFMKYQVLIGAIVVQMILGTLYGYSIFWQPLSAKAFPEVITQAEEAGTIAAGKDMANYTVVADDDAKKELKSTQQGYLKYAFSICILSFAIVMVIAGRVQDIKGPRFPAVVGAILMGGGFMFAGMINHAIVFYIAHAAFAGVVAIVLLMVYHALFGKMDPEQYPVLKYLPMGIATSVIVASVLLGNQYVGKLGELDKLFMLWGTIGFMAGAGIGFTYVCPLAALVKWFPEHKGLVSGLAVAGFGFGAFLFKGKTIGAVGFISEHDISQFFIVHGAVCLVGITAGAMLLKNPPGTAAGSTSTSDSTWQDTVRRPAFYLLWLMFFSGSMAGLMVIGSVKGFAGEQLVEAATTAGSALSDDQVEDLLVKGAAAVGWLAIFNAIGRVAWGFVSDKLGRTTAFVAMFLFQAAMMFVLASLNTELSLAVGASIVGFNFGGNFALFPSATADVFGAKNMGANYGWVFTSYGIAGVAGVAIGNAAKTSTGSYSAAFMIAAVLCVVSAAMAIQLRSVIFRQAAALPEPA